MININNYDDDQLTAKMIIMMRESEREREMRYKTIMSESQVSFFALQNRNGPSLKQKLASDLHSGLRPARHLGLLLINTKITGTQRAER